MSKSRLLLKTNGVTNEQCFTVGSVYTRDHGPRCSIAGVRNRPQGIYEELIGCPFSRWYQEGGSQCSPRLPGGRGVIGSDTDQIFYLPYPYPHPTFGYGFGYGYYRV